jgi:hypothetical protein
MEPQPRGLVKWAVILMKTPPRVILERTGLDGYFSLRYLRMLVIIFTGGMILTWATLLPINAINGKGNLGGVNGLDVLTISNISSRNKYWAHVIVAYIFTAFSQTLIVLELRHFVSVRQSFLSRPTYSQSIVAKTILVSSIPHNWLDSDALAKLYSVFPGGVQTIHINRDFSKLTKIIKRRDKAYKKLEGAVLELLRIAYKKAQKAQAEKNSSERVKCPKSLESRANIDVAADPWIEDKDRPQHRLKAKGMPEFLPHIGKKVSVSGT